MKILALDIGDMWTGSAISDPLGMFARPYHTTKSKSLIEFITQVIKKENIQTIIVGHPRTMRGTKSAQTQKVEATKEQLEKQFPSVFWKLWDERLSSKRALDKKKGITKEDKIHSHSIAAAFILDSYLSYLQNKKNLIN